MAPTSLKSSSMVRPTIRKGRRISQISGNKKRTIRAIGQQMTRRMHHRTRERKKLMIRFSSKKAKGLPIAEIN